MRRNRVPKRVDSPFMPRFFYLLFQAGIKEDKSPGRDHRVLAAKILYSFSPAGGKDAKVKRYPASTEEERRQRMYIIETELRRAGYKVIAGVDEAGRGPLAGPGVAAAVVFPPDVAIEGIDDSKKLSPARRERVYARIRKEGIPLQLARLLWKRSTVLISWRLQEWR